MIRPNVCSENVVERYVHETLIFFGSRVTVVTGHGCDGSRWWRVTVVTGHGGDGSSEMTYCQFCMSAITCASLSVSLLTTSSILSNHFLLYAPIDLRFRLYQQYNQTSHSVYSHCFLQIFHTQFKLVTYNTSCDTQNAAKKNFDENSNFSEIT